MNGKSAAGAHQANINAAQPDQAPGGDAEPCTVTACSKSQHGLQSDAVLCCPDAHDSSDLATSSEPSDNSVVSGTMVVEPPDNSQHAVAQRDASATAGTKRAAMCCQQAELSHLAHHHQEAANQGQHDDPSCHGLLLRLRNQVLTMKRMQPLLLAASPN